ncbi:MAG: hypothetical protein QXW77_02835 [Candidatus Hadarchaeales archaeon]
MRLKLLLPVFAGVAVTAAVLLLPRPAPAAPKARVIGPNFPDRRQLQYLAVESGTGIECIYLVKSWSYDPTRDLSTQNFLARIQRSLEQVEIPSGELFDIVVVVRATAPPVMRDTERIGIACVDKRYFRVRLLGTYSTDNSEYVFEESGYGTGAGYLRANVVFDNDGERFMLGEGEVLRLEDVGLEVVA